MEKTITKRILSAGGAILVAAMLVACGSSSQSQEPATAETGDEPKHASVEETAAPVVASNATNCKSDADCVKDACCHATGCVPNAQAPKCDEVMCTMDCKEGTLDCGQGACTCVDGACSVKWAK